MTEECKTGAAGEQIAKEFLEMKKYISWNVNGLRAVMGKGFMDFFHSADADAFCLQETKLQEGQLELELPGYHQFWDYAEKKGYSGTAIFTKAEPLSVMTGMPFEKHDHEGRSVCLEFEDHYLLTVYVPNSQDGLKRLDYRMEWEDDWRGYVSELSRKKPVVFCGDLNVAHMPIDIKNPSSNHENAGFSDEERAKMSRLLSSGFVDSYRYLHPDKQEFSWWSYRMNARAKNIGWRIDYFIVSEALKKQIKDAFICGDIMGSDHAPVGIVLDI